MADNKGDRGYLTEKGASELVGDPELNRMPVRTKPNGYGGNHADFYDDEGTVLGSGRTGEHSTPNLAESELGQAENARTKYLKRKRGL
jgi:hypothetical protein